MISFDDVSLYYENKLALDQIHLTIPSGQITGIIGPNGAGKTTLMKVALGLFREVIGQVTIDGHSVQKERDYVKQHCTYAPEETRLFPYLTGLEFLQLIASLRQMPKHKSRQEIEDLTNLLQMDAFTDNLIVDYSHGMRQKMLIAAALLGWPSHIFIDEALNGLDAPALFRLKAHVQSLVQQGKTIVLASHNLALIYEWCNSVVILHRGHVLAHWKKSEIEKRCAQSGKSFPELFLELVGEK